jgi:hypothetical protein
MQNHSEVFGSEVSAGQKRKVRKCVIATQKNMKILEHD